MNELTYNVNGERLTALELYLLENIITEHDGTYVPEDISDGLQAALDMLVLSSALERDMDFDGKWQNSWSVSDDAWEWIEPIVDLVSYIKFTVGEA